ncbi:hypothetical protein EMIT0P74_220084 [Pseudomonas sp. IT-P74]
MNAPCEYASPPLTGLATKKPPLLKAAFFCLQFRPVTGHSSTIKPRSPIPSANQPTAVKLAQVRTFSRRERTGTQRAPLPPNRVEIPQPGPGTEHLKKMFLCLRKTTDEKKPPVGRRFFFLKKA